MSEPLNLSTNEKLPQGLMTPIEYLEVSVRAYNVFKKYDFKTVGDLVQKSDAELLRLKNFGARSLRQVKTELANLGLSLGTHRTLIPSSENQVNAVLVAAAPDLYQIAEMWDLVMDEGDYNRVMKSNGMKTGDFVKQVLAKARGRIA